MLPEPAPAQWPLVGQTLATTKYEAFDVTYEDYFSIQDENTSIGSSLAGDPLVSILGVNERNPELTPGDWTFANPLARPEIEVTRINAKHLGRKPGLTGFSTDGLGVFDTNGKPRAVPTTSPYASVVFSFYEDVEQRLLVDYFARNHAFRSGSNSTLPYRVGAFRAAAGLQSPTDFDALLSGADPSGFAAPVPVDLANIVEYVNWLKTPMTLRGVEAHADWLQAQFDAPPNVAALDTAVGGTPWRWQRRQVDASNWLLEPTLSGSGLADVSFYRTLWENGALAGAGEKTFMIHGGCSVNSVANGHLPYSASTYGQNNHAEALLFLQTPLEAMARAKVFNDTPRGVGQAMYSSKRFSTSLGGYFTADANDATLNSSTSTSPNDRANRVLQRKRTYVWGVLGDFTLRFKY